MRPRKGHTQRRGAIRDREATRGRILSAVGDLLAAEGFRALGINAIARRARADKALIYRYFGGLPELLAAYAEEGDFWWKVEDLVGAHLRPPARDTLAGWIGLVFRRHVAALRARPATLEIMAWETIERNELTAADGQIDPPEQLELGQPWFTGRIALGDAAQLDRAHGATSSTSRLPPTRSANASAVALRRTVRRGSIT